MNTSKYFRHICSVCTLLLIPTASFTQDRTPIEKLVNNFPLKLSKQARSADLPVLLTGGDKSVYFAMRTSEFFPTAILPSQQPTRPLSSGLIPEIGDIKAETMHFGTLSLDDFLAKSESYAQGFIVMHKGKIVYEKYPRMKPKDHHVWMSNAKVTASLVIDLLINDGKIDEKKTMGDYVPEFRGTPTGTVTVKDVLDMTTGLNSDEYPETRSDPNSIATRTFRAEFGMLQNGKVERLIDVLKDAKFVAKPGEKFQYASASTQLLVYLAEAVGNKRWSEIFDERVWSKVSSDAPIQLHMTPDGVVAAHGLISSNLRDLARFGMLYTPNWDKVATEQIVTPVMISRIRNGVRTKEFFLGGFNGPAFVKIFADDTIISNSRQWDIIWPDGDFWKGGMMSQGLYVSPDKNLVIAYFSLNGTDRSIDRYLRPIANSKFIKGNKK
ncbi:MAG: serine hydrolase [Epsilonproteobacteria bacterium]|nr:MAG: serine hydrolase [Campylobacterota bacterium]